MTQFQLEFSNSKPSSAKYVRQIQLLKIKSIEQFDRHEESVRYRNRLTTMSRRLLKNVRRILLTHALAANAHTEHGLSSVARRIIQHENTKAKRKIQTKIEKTEQTTTTTTEHVRTNAHMRFRGCYCRLFAIPLAVWRTPNSKQQRRNNETKREKNRTTKYRQSHTIERSLRLLGIIIWC